MTEATENGDTHTAEAVRKVARKERVSRVMWALAGVFLSLAVVVTGLVVFVLARELHDARDDIEANRVENTCRAELAARLDVLDSDISYEGWLGLAAYVRGDEAEVARRVARINALDDERTAAAEDRASIVEFCDETPAGDELIPDP